MAASFRVWLSASCLSDISVAMGLNVRKYRIVYANRTSRMLSTIDSYMGGSARKLVNTLIEKFKAKTIISSVKKRPAAVWRIFPI